MGVNSSVSLTTRCLLTLAMVLEIVVSQMNCNVDILNRYLLKGREFSISNRMRVCPTVRENCCTVADEVNIHSLWKFRSKLLLDRYRDRVIPNIYQTMDMFWQIVKYDPQLMMVKFRIAKDITIQPPVCQTMMRQITRKQIQEVKNYYHWASHTKIPKKPLSDKFFNTWYSRNPAHVNWNIKNYGYNYDGTSLMKVPKDGVNGRGKPNGWPAGIGNVYKFEKLLKFSKHNFL